MKIIRLFVLMMTTTIMICSSAQAETYMTKSLEQKEEMVDTYFDNTDAKKTTRKRPHLNAREMQVFIVHERNTHAGV